MYKFIKAIFKNHPKEDTVFITSDETPFFKKNHAESHASGLDDKRVMPVTRKEIDAISDPDEAVEFLANKAKDSGANEGEEPEGGKGSQEQEKDDQDKDPASNKEEDSEIGKDSQVNNNQDKDPAGDNKGEEPSAEDERKAENPGKDKGKKK